MAISTPGSVGLGRAAASLLKSKMEARAFDVFLCHNSADKPAVRSLGEELKQQGVLPWLDEWELRPGMPWQRALEQEIDQVKSAAVFVGAEGVGPWQHNEIDAFLRRFVHDQRPVIPILLPSAPREPALPLFLEGMTWVDFRTSDPDPMERLLWGITGERTGVAHGALLTPAASAPANRPASPMPPVPPFPAPNLSQTLPGQWRVEITNQFGAGGGMSLQMMPNGFFRGVLQIPIGITNVEGQWQVVAPNQIQLQGRQFMGFYVMPYWVMVQFSEISATQLAGFTQAGEQTRWQKIG